MAVVQALLTKLTVAEHATTSLREDESYDENFPLLSVRVSPLID